MSSSTTLSIFCRKLSLDSCGFQDSSEEDLKVAKASQKPRGPERCNWNWRKGQSWRISDVSVEFNVNPASVITFRGDVQGRRILAADTNADLQFVKGLPLLSVGKRNVRNWQCDYLKEMLTSHSLPVVLRFGYLTKLQPISFSGTLGNMENWSEECKRRAEIISELVTTERNLYKRSRRAQ